MVDFLLGFTVDNDAERGQRSLVTEEGDNLSVTPVPFTAGGVTGVTATAPLTSTGGAAPNLALTSPSRAYGRGAAFVLTTSAQVVAEASLVPSNTGKLQISVWCVVTNAGETESSFIPAIIDTLGNTLWVSTVPVTVPSGSPAPSSAFAVTIDSDLATGGTATPHTYALGVLATIQFVLAQVTGVTGEQSVADGSSGILVKENTV